MPRHRYSRHQAVGRKNKQRKTARLRGAAGGIRRYGPGKFNNIVDGVVYDWSLNGFGDSIGDVQDFGSYTLVGLGREVLREIEKDTDEKLTTAEKNLLRGSAGAIVEGNDQGFVGVSYYKTNKELERAWARIEKAYDKFLEEFGEDDFEDE